MNIGKLCATLQRRKIWVTNMKNTTHKHIADQVSTEGLTASDRDAEVQSLASQSYEKPVLIAYGDVRDVTLGPTPGLGESGCEFQRRTGSPLSCP